MEAMFEGSYMGSKVSVFSNKLVWRFLLKEQTIPINQIASVELGIPGYAGITVETTGGKKYKIPVSAFGGQKQKLQEAIYNAQSGDKSDGNASSADELEKLANLKEKGIISEDEFNQKKKQLLNL